MTRYIIRHEHSERSIAWSHNLAHALAFAHSLRSFSIPCFVEVAR